MPRMGAELANLCFACCPYNNFFLLLLFSNVLQLFKLSRRVTIYLTLYMLSLSNIVPNNLDCHRDMERSTKKKKIDSGLCAGGIFSGAPSLVWMPQRRLSAEQPWGDCWATIPRQQKRVKNKFA